MKLRVSSTSPYVRKVLICAMETGLIDQIEQIPTTPWSADTDLPKDNPLCKIPALITDAGEVIFDSPVICEYLDSLHSGSKLIPQGAERFNQLVLQALGDGILDANMNYRIETAMRPPELKWQGWVDRQLAAINRALDVLEGQVASWGETFLIGQITVIAAIEHADLRVKLDWRSTRPNLAAWVAKTSQRPSVLATVPRE